MTTSYGCSNTALSVIRSRHDWIKSTKLLMEVCQRYSHCAHYQKVQCNTCNLYREYLTSNSVSLFASMFQLLHAHVTFPAQILTHRTLQFSSSVWLKRLPIVSQEPTQFIVILHFRATEVEFAIFLLNGCTALFCRVCFCKLPYNTRLMSYSDSFQKFWCHSHWYICTCNFLTKLSIE